MQVKGKEILCLTAILAIIATSTLLLARPRKIYGNPTGEVSFEFPSKLGTWTSESVWFCQSDTCARAFSQSELQELGRVELPGNCPECQGTLSKISIGENTLLPENTPIFRVNYKKTDGRSLCVALVFSGIERRSIHRPQVCLVAQGNRITDEYEWEAPINGGRTLPVEILEFSQPIGTGKNAKSSNYIYCYWLFNPERETNKHLDRLVRTIYDNAFRSYRPRWCYASITIPRDGKVPNAWQSDLADFMPLFHPLIDKVRKDLDATRDSVLTISGTSADLNVSDKSGLTRHTKKSSDNSK